MPIIRKAWRIFVHLFGLDTCPLPPTQTVPKRKETKEDRDRRKRVHRMPRHG